MGLVAASSTRTRPFDFNPPTPCGVGLAYPLSLPHYFLFQSTHPVRGGTYQEINGVTLAGISIHPPRAGWDGKSWPYRARTWNFNPPTPCGVGRLAIAPDQGRGVEFQSTHPVRGGTQTVARRHGRVVFQSTHPVRGGTTTCLQKTTPQTHFNPPTPCGVGPFSCTLAN